MRFIFNSLTFLFLLCATLSGQSVSSLTDNFSGTVNWNAAEGVITFETSGSINLTFKDNFRHFIWDVPEEVKTIVIKENVTVNGAFHTRYNCTIKGEDRKTSVLFGTNEREWSKKKRDQGFGDVRAFNYSTIEALSGTTYVQNLTCLNPWGFHVRGGMLHVSYCDFIDNRGGHGNNSDGFVGSNGSTVDNCFFSTGDDIIKVYNNVTVTNTTIEMVDNAVPIQLGWGTYGDGAIGTFNNLTITGNSGRGNDGRAIIVARTGTYNKTINIDGCDIQNPNATWLSLREKGQIVKGEVINAKIKLSQFWGPFAIGTNQMTICGTSAEINNFDCTLVNLLNENIVSGVNIYPNPVKEKIIIKGTTSKYNIQVRDLSGKLKYSNHVEKADHSINVRCWGKGMYVINITNGEMAIIDKFIIL
jgi:hypothetical protein